MVNRERAIAKFMELVQIDSVSYNEREVADYLLAHFTALGYEAYEDTTPLAHVPKATCGNVIVKVPGTKQGPTIIFEAHMDTVEPGNGVKPSITADGAYVVSDGTTILGADDKAGIAQMLELERVLVETGTAHYPLEFIFTICEEVGSYGAEHLDMSRIDGRIAYVLDAGAQRGDAIIGGPDYYDVYGTITGKAAHAGGAPDKGISSIQVMSHAIANMKLLKIDEDTTTNVGSVICDYPLNVVPEVTTFGIEVRSLVPAKGEAQLAHVVDTIQAAADKFGATVTFSITKSLEAYHMDDNTAVMQHYRKACEKHGVVVNPTVIRGGTDVSALAKNGIEAIAISAGGQYAHELRERLIIDKFIENVEQIYWLATE